MKSPLNILHLEDNLHDALLVRAIMEDESITCAITRVQSLDGFVTALEHGGIDLILSDFSLPGFNGLAALKLARQQHKEVPFIFLSGTIGEEVAVESLKEGAVDYIVKDRISRLPSAVLRAISEAQKQAESLRMEARIHEQAMLLDCAQDAICLNDMGQTILYWNRSAERFYGWKAREAVGKNAIELLSLDDQSTQAEALHSLIRQGEWKGELHQITKDNKEIIVESRWTLIRDGAGEPKSILLINTDITEKKQIEAQMLRTQRVETIGALAGGIAHDLNNTLTPVLMGISLLRHELTTPEARKVLDMMAGSAKRGVEMVHQILSFSRGVGGTHEPLQIEPIVREMSQLATKTFPRNIKIETSIAKALPDIIGNPTQLHQICLNLCVNARDAMPEGGLLKIDASSVELKRSQLPEGVGFNAGQYVAIEVSDTGGGIPPENHKKIFEPFFSTKELCGGTGLGLSTVMGIVKTHGGFLELTSEVGRGTKFKVYLPATKPSVKNQPDPMFLNSPSE